MGLFSHRVRREELVAGDHIYTYRAVFTYSHHGIYVGEDRVIHFTNDEQSTPTGIISFQSSGSSLGYQYYCSKLQAACSNFPDCGSRQSGSGVITSCLNCFLKDGSLYRFEYRVSPSIYIANVRPGTCTTAKCDPSEMVIDRAMYLFRNGFGNYDLFNNNCEDFAMYCKTGLLVIDSPSKGTSGQVYSIPGASLATLISIPLKFLSGPVGTVAATVAATAMYCMSRYATDLGVREDVAKVPVEEVASFCGWAGAVEKLPEENEACARPNATASSGQLFSS